MNGEIELRVDCLMPEKLIQRATDAGVRFDYVKRPDDHSVVVGIQARDERAMSDICERFAIPVDVTARRGRCAAERRARSRWTLLAGLAVFVAASWLFLSRVWNIDIEFSGSAVGRGDEAAVRQVLEDMGVRPGIGRDIDTSLLSSELLARMDGVSFAGTRVEGVRLRVEAAPEAPPPEVYDIEASRDLYASRGGIVVSVNAEAGEPCVKPGDTVRRGQLLIRGEEKASSEGTRGIAARGEVVVRTWFEGRATGAVNVERSVETGRQSVSAWLDTAWIDLPIVEGERFSRQEVSREVIPVGGLFLPVGVIRETARETRTIREKTDQALLSDRLSAMAFADAREALTRDGPSAFEITDSWIRFSQENADVLEARAALEITMNTASAREEIPGG